MQTIIAPEAPYRLTSLNYIGWFIVLLGVIGGLLWAALTPLDSAVVALGKLKVHSERKQIQHFEGGIVDTILVEEGDLVERNQLLFVLDDTFAHTDLDRISIQRQELKIREAILLAQRDRLPAPVIPADFLTEARDSWMEGQLQQALDGFNISESNLRSELAILDNQSFQLNEQITGIESEVSAKEEELAFLIDEIDSWKKLLDQKLTSKLRYLELQREASELKGEVAQLKSQAASLRVKHHEIRLQALRVEQDYREKAAKALAEVQLNLKDNAQRKAAAKNILDRIEVRSPVTGTIVGLNVHTLGAVVKPGETLVEVVPEEDELIVEARVKPLDVDKVYESMRSRIKISSYKVHEFPEFEGVVESVSADVFEDPATLQNFYLARIALIEQSIDEQLLRNLKPGMPSEVLIMTGQSTPLQYLLEPLLSAFRTAWRDQ